MFSPQNELLCVALLICTMTCWGSWPSIRILVPADAPVFEILYITGQWTAAIILSISFGMMNFSNENFDNETIFSGFADIGEPWRVIPIMVGGFCLANADFLCSCACTRLPFSISYPIFAGWALIQATILCYFVEGPDYNVPMLFGGVGLALCAILCMALSDAYAKSGTDAGKYKSFGFDGEAPVESEDESLKQNLEKPLLLSSFDHSESQQRDKLMGSDSHSEDGNNRDSSSSQFYTPRPSSHSSLKELEAAALSATSKSNSQNDGNDGINPWIYGCLLAGFLGGLWTPLSLFGRNGSGSVKNPYVCVLIYMTGELIALPVMLSYYAYVIIPLERGTFQLCRQQQQYGERGVGQDQHNPLLHSRSASQDRTVGVGVGVDAGVGEDEESEDGGGNQFNSISISSSGSSSMGSNNMTATAALAAATGIRGDSHIQTLKTENKQRKRDRHHKPDEKQEGVQNKKDSRLAYNGGDNLHAYFVSAFSMSTHNKLVGIFTGFIVGMGYLCFFLASEVVSSTISFAIANCAPLVSIIIGVTIFRQLEAALCMQRTFMVAAFFLFLTALSLMVIANSI